MGRDNQGRRGCGNGCSSSSDNNNEARKFWQLGEGELLPPELRLRVAAAARVLEQNGFSGVDTAVTDTLLCGTAAVAAGVPHQPATHTNRPAFRDAFARRPSAAAYNRRGDTC